MKEKPVYLLSSYIQNILNSLVTLLVDNYPSVTRGISEGLQLASARRGSHSRPHSHSHQVGVSGTLNFYMEFITFSFLRVKIRHVYLQHLQESK